MTQVKAGNLVGSGEATWLTTVSQVDPIIFRAGISEADYLHLNVTREARIAAMGEEGTMAELLLADGKAYPHRGKLTAVDRAVDPTTGTLSFQVTFPNPDRLLRPGQFGRARVALDVKKNALLVLQRAVQELQDQHIIVVITPDNKANIRRVKVGPRVGDLWVIEEGLQPGEKVVVEGLQRLRDGMTVNAVAAAAPPATADGAKD
jgi:membrane fusion protein (multidrug efflux system)